MDPIDRAGSGVPSVRWTARASHWETQWRRVTETREDESGRRHTSTRWEPHREQVTTHVADVHVPALRWEYEERRAGMRGVARPWTSVRAHFRVCPADAHEWREYEQLKSEFQHAHDRDDHLAFTETLTLSGRALSKNAGAYSGEVAWSCDQFFLVVSQATAFGRPTLLTWVLVSVLMLSAPYQAWLASRMKAIGASAAVEYTRSFKLDLEAARAQLHLGERALVDRERALERRQRWRTVRFVMDTVGTALS
jgi:hypothetical protein